MLYQKKYGKVVKKRHAGRYFHVTRVILDLVEVAWLFAIYRYAFVNPTSTLEITPLPNVLSLVL